MINTMEDLLPFLAEKRKDILSLHRDMCHYPSEDNYIDGYLACLEDTEMHINKMDQAFIDAIHEALNDE